MGKALLLSLIVVCAGSGRAAVPGLPGLTIPDCLGVNIHFTGLQDKQVEMIAAAGFRFIRMDCAWKWVEPQKGQMQLKGHDDLIDSLDRHGLRALLILDYGHPLYTKDLAPDDDAGRAAFARYASACAEHFKNRGVAWEIWNEPNHPQFWRPGPNVEDYVKLAKTTSAALRKADPQCTVLAPALSTWDFDYLESAFKLGLLDCIDAVSVHPYGAAKPEDAGYYYSRVRSLIRRYAPKDKDVPIVSGEWGYPSFKGISEQNQAEYLVRMYLVNIMNGIRLSIWYVWTDGKRAEESLDHYGVVTADLQEKPAYVATRTLTTELNGCTYANRITLGQDDDYLLLFRKGDDYRLAAWTSGAAHSVRLPVDLAGADVVSLAGERAKIEAKNDAINLRLSGAVQYVEPEGKSRRWQIEAGWRVSATTRAEKGGVVAQITSGIGDPKAETAVSGSGLKDAGKPVVRTSGDSSEAISSSPYVPGGSSRRRAKVTVTVAGLDEPLVRVVEIDPFACPRVEALPPTNNELLIAVNQPESGAADAFEGKLIVGNCQGIRLADESCPVKLAAGSDRAVVRLKMTQMPAAIYSFACKLVNRDGRDVVSLPARRYAVVDTFADGEIGKPVTRYGTALDGDPKVAAKADLVYAESPSGAPAAVCARLDYEFGEGWRFVRVCPKTPARMFGEPRSVKLWVKGNATGFPAGLRFSASDGQTFQESYGRLYSGDWRVMSSDLTGAGATYWGAAMDGVIRYPVSWNSLFLIDNTSKAETKGSVYIGPMMLCYDE